MARFCSSADGELTVMPMTWVLTSTTTSPMSRWAKAEEASRRPSRRQKALRMEDGTKNNEECSQRVFVLLPAPSSQGQSASFSKHIFPPRDRRHHQGSP